MNDERRAVLRAVCDTVYPRIERDDDPDGFFARSATDMGLPEAVEDLIEQIPDETIRGGLEQLLDVLGQQGFLRMPSQDSREQLLRNLALASPDAAAGVSALAGMTLFLAYGAPDPNTGLNPNWKTFGYPGPSGVPPQVPKLLDVKTPADGDTIDADVCIVGSGSGGGVIAGTLAKQGHEGGRPRGVRLLQRVRLRAARAAGVPGDVLARRADAERGRQHQHAGGDDPRRRHHDQLDELPADHRLGPERLGRTSTASRDSTGPTTTATSTRCSSGSARPTAAAT